MTTYEFFLSGVFVIGQQGQEIPSLDGLAYRAQRFIETGSKMSNLLLAYDRHEQLVALKIAYVEQQARADVNRLAIKNTVEWLSKLGHYRGIIALQPIDFAAQAWWRRWLARPTYCAVLTAWPNQPEFLAMEYIGGGSLRDLVDNQRLDLKTTLWIAHYIARALAYVHQRGCVHRDIKPENILFRTLPEAAANQGDSLPILIDFGVAAAIGEDRLVSGSRLWMAPELQAAYEKRPLPVDPSWDVYALGLILCYMLSGRRPRHKTYASKDYEVFREQALAVLDREIAEIDSALITVKAQIEQLIDTTLASAPEKRPTAEAFARTTSALLDRLGAPLPSPEHWLMRWEQSVRLSMNHRHWLRLGGALLLVLLLLTAMGYAAQQGLFYVGIAIPVLQPTIAVTEAPLTLTAPDANSAVGLTSTVTALATLPRVSPTVPLPTPSPTATVLAPAPTLMSLAVITRETVPTLVPLTTLASAVPPTLALFTPTATPVPPTPTPVPPTPTVPTRTPRPTLTPRPSPTPKPTTTPLPTSTPVVGRVQLLAPNHGVRASQDKVVFSWALADHPLAPEACFELVFWVPGNIGDKRSPIGAGKATQARIDFSLLINNPDPLLHTIAQSRQPFNWGVRMVACARPATILKDVEEVRAYTYDGQ